MFSVRINHILYPFYVLFQNQLLWPHATWTWHSGQGNLREALKMTSSADIARSDTLQNSQDLEMFARDQGYKDESDEEMDVALKEIYQRNIHSSKLRYIVIDGSNVAFKYASVILSLFKHRRLYLTFYIIKS